MLRSSVFFLILGLTQVSTAQSARNFGICKSWNCINDELGFSVNGIQSYTRAEIESYLNEQLIEDAWREDVKSALDTCFKDKKPRMFSRVCPGQEIWHCILDQLIQNCPQEKTKEGKSCNLVGSAVGSKYLFYQNVYEDDVNTTGNNDHRPKFFLKSVFKSKCCDLPDLFGREVLNTCNVTTFMNTVQFKPTKPTKRSRNPFSEAYCAQQFENINPFECCNMSDVLKADTFDTCSLNMEWNNGKGLVIVKRNDELDEKPTKAPNRTDITFVKVVPEDSKPLNCVFRKLNISTNGEVNKKAFERLLDNMTREHPAWKIAKYKVPHRCFERDLKMEYEGSPEQRLLACTIDVLSENCPHGKKGFADPCRRHSSQPKVNTVCEISNSKFRHPPYKFCDLPRLVPQKTLEACGLISLTRMEVIKKKHPAPPTPKKYNFIQNNPNGHKHNNKEADCVLVNMGVSKNNKVEMEDMTEYLNKTFNKNRSWAVVKSRVQETVKLMPAYTEHDESTRRLLNLVDATLTNCPIIKRKYTNKCARFYGYQSKCNIKPNNNPQQNPYVPLLPMNKNVILFHPNTNAPVSNIPITHTVKYAPRFVHYAPKYTYSVHTQDARIPTISDQKQSPEIIPTPLLSKVFSPVYSYSHDYPKYQVHGQLKVKDAYKTNVPIFHSSIADQNKNEPAMLQHLLPVDGQVFE